MVANVNNKSGMFKTCKSLLKPSRLGASASIILSSQILVLFNDLGAFSVSPLLNSLMCLFA